MRVGLYIADSYHDRILKETPSGNGYVQGIVADSNLGGTPDVAVDGKGNVYFSDVDQNVIHKAVPSGNGYVLTTVPTNSLNEPFGIAVDASGNVYISDSYNDRVLKETLSGNTYVQSTITDWHNGLSFPNGLIVDASGSVFIADEGTNRILKETVTSTGYSETVVVASGLSKPTRMAIDAADNLYIADNGSNRVLKETASNGGYTQTVVATSPLSGPLGVALDAQGRLFVADTNNNRVLEIQASGAQYGSINLGAAGSTASMLFTFDTAGVLGGAPVVSTQGAANLDFADAGTGSCSAGRVYGHGDVCTVDVTFTPKYAGIRQGAALLQGSSGSGIAAGYVQGVGTGPQVRFLPGMQSVVATGLVNPRDVAVDSSGNTYIADTDNQQVWKVPSAGAAAPVILNQSSLQWPCGVAVDGAGNVYISDTFHGRILKESLLNGSYTESVIVSSGLFYPRRISLDGSGNLYIADAGNNRIVKALLNMDGSYSLNPLPFKNLNSPEGVAVDAAGNVYIADTNNNRILEEIFSGTAYIESVLRSNLAAPFAVAVDAGGNVYIPNNSDDRILEETPSGTGYVENVLYTGDSELDSVAVDPLGNLYITRTSDGQVIKKDYADAPALNFAATPVGTTSSEQQVSLQNIGNAPLSFPAPSSGSNPALSANFILDTSVTNSCPQEQAGQQAGSLSPDASCVLAVGFAPTAAGNVQGNLVIADNNLNAANGMQTLSLSGTGSAQQSTLTLSAPPTATYGNPVQVTANVSDNVTGSPVNGGTVNFADRNGSFGSAAVQSGMASNSYLAPSIGTFTLSGAYTPSSSTVSSSNAQTQIQITAAPLTVAANNLQRVYGAANPQFAGTITGAVNGDSFTESFTTSANVRSSVANYSIVPSASGANLGNYTQMIQNGSLQITPAGLTVTADNATRTYGAPNPSFSGTVTGALNGDTFTRGFTTSATAASPVNNYEIVPSISGASASNYIPTIQNGTLSITPAKLTVTAADVTRTYGAANPQFTGTVAGAVNEDTFVETFTTSATAASPVAKYSITPAVSGSALTNYRTSIINGTLTISPAALTVKANDAKRTYGTANPTFSGVLTGAVNNDSFVPSYSTAANLTSSAGSYPIVAKVTGANLGNYTQTLTSGTLTITAAALTISADNATRPYGVANPSFTGSVSGLVNGDAVSEAFYTSATPRSSIGTYSIVPSTTGSAPANYDVTAKNGILTITQAALRLTADAATRTYGGANPNFTGTMTGAAAGDLITEQFTTTATQNSVPGTYSIVPSAQAQGSVLSNYNVNAANGTLTIARAPLIASVQDSSRLYGAANPSFTGTVKGAVNGESFVESFTTTAAAHSSVGSYLITPTVTGPTLDSYLATMQPGTLTVTPTPLTVNAASATRPYGTPNPSLTGSLSGLVQGDVIEASFSSAAALSAAPGPYPIVASLTGSALPNYAVQPVTAVLTVVQAATVTTSSVDTSASLHGGVAIHVQVRSGTTGIPTGIVRFFSGKHELGEATLANGTASFQLVRLPKGANSAVEAVYQGDVDFLPSSADPLPVHVPGSSFSVSNGSGAMDVQVKAGEKAVLTFQVAPGDGDLYPGAVAFSAAGLPAGATASFSPATLAPDGGAQTVTVTIQTAAPTASAATAENHPHRGMLRGLGEASLALLLLPLAGTRRLRAGAGRLTVVTLLVAGGLFGSGALTGCGFAPGSGLSSSTAKAAPEHSASYTVVITATSAGITESTTATLTVQL